MGLAHGLAPQYQTEIFSRNSQGSLHILRNTSMDLKLPLLYSKLKLVNYVFIQRSKTLE